MNGWDERIGHWLNEHTFAAAFLYYALGFIGGIEAARLIWGLP